MKKAMSDDQIQPLHSFWTYVLIEVIELTETQLAEVKELTSQDILITTGGADTIQSETQPFTVSTKFSAALDSMEKLADQAAKKFITHCMSPALRKAIIEETSTSTLGIR